VLAAAVVLTVVVISAAPAALAAGPSVSVSLTPNPGGITAGGSLDFQATAYPTVFQEAVGNSSDSFEVISTTITIADGTCAPTTAADTYSCGATTAGTHTVTATVTYTYQDTTGDTTSPATGTASSTATWTCSPGRRPA
jgi:hypothetical protein